MNGTTAHRQLPPGIPLRQMCSTIAEASFLIRRNGSLPTARDIYAYSSIGGMALISAWHVKACLNLGRIEEAAAGQGMSVIAYETDSAFLHRLTVHRMPTAPKFSSPQAQ